MSENILNPIPKLGELIFNGTVLFLSIAFGLFTLSLGSGNITINGITGFVVFVIFVMLFGIASIILSLSAIQHNRILLVYIAAGCFLVMMSLLTYGYIQAYLQTITTQTQLVVNTASIR